MIKFLVWLTLSLVVSAKDRDFYAILGVKKNCK